MNMPPGTRLALGRLRDDNAAEFAAVGDVVAVGANTAAATGAAVAAGAAAVDGVAVGAAVAATVAMPQAPTAASAHVNKSRTPRIERLFLSCHSCFQRSVRQARFDLLANGYRVGVGNQFAVGDTLY